MDFFKSNSSKKSQNKSSRTTESEPNIDNSGHFRQSSPASNAYVTESLAGREFKNAFQIHEPTKTFSESGGLDGQYLNTLDGDLTAGLERYFPTPSFRLRISQKRLASQIKAIREEYDEYDRLPGKTPEMIERQRRLGHRLIVLEQQEVRVSRELASILVLGRFFTWLFERHHQLNNLCIRFLGYLRRQMTRLLRGENYVAVSQANEELNSLYKVLSARLSDPQASPAELGRILNLYDRLYAQANRTSTQIKPSPNKLL